MSLSQEEKEQVAVLLGWEGVRWECACGASYETRNQGERNCGDVAPMVTLEACMEYAKGKGWDYGVFFEDNEHSAWVYPNVGMESVWGEGADDLSAMVRALLKAEEASRE